MRRIPKDEEYQRPARSEQSDRRSRLRLGGILVALALIASTFVGLQVGNTSPASAQSGFDQYVPTITEAKYNGAYVSVKWSLRSDQEKVNVYRNGSYIKTLTGTVWNDSDGKSGNKYYVVAISKDGKFSKRSAEQTATGGGEVSGVKNLRITQNSSKKITLTWQATSTAIKEFRIYRGGTHSLTVKASITDPGRTYNYWHDNSTAENAPYYVVRPVGPYGLTGLEKFVLNPISEDAVNDMRADSAARNRTLPKPTVVGGRSTTSKNLAANLNAANDTAEAAAQDYDLKSLDAMSSFTEAIRVTKGETAQKAGTDIGIALNARKEAERTAGVAQQHQKAYDGCRFSPSCWNGPTPTPDDDPDPTTPTTSDPGPRDCFEEGTC